MSAETGEEAVLFRGVSKTYGTLVALDAIDLRIPRGQSVAILGPNGAGKTTALSLLLGLRNPTAGSLSVLGGKPREQAVRARVGAMLQSSGLPEYLRVDEAIALFRSYYPAPLPIDELLALAGLTEKARSRIARLSGGQVQRLYFALALCGNPELLVLDEPTVGLDVEARRSLLATISEIANRGRTVLMSTHYLEEADAVSDRVVVIDRGRIIADGTPSEVKGTVGRKRVAFTSRVAFDDVRLSRNGERYEALTESPELLLRDLFTRGIEIDDLTVTGATLEEAFLALTGGENKHVA